MDCIYEGVEEQKSLANSRCDSGRIRVMIVHNLRLDAEMFVRALNEDGRFEAFRSLGKLEILYADLKEQQPQVVLVSAEWRSMDIQPEDVVRLCHSTLPQVRTVLFLDRECAEEIVVDAFRAGARGVIDGDDSLETLKRCIQSVAEGQIWGRNEYLHNVLQGLARLEGLLVKSGASGDHYLTKREREILQFVAAGLTNRDIAARLNLSVHTIKNYLFRLFGRLGVSNRAELVAYAVNHQPAASGSSITGDLYHA